MQNARPFIDGGRHVRVSGSLYQEKARSQTARGWNIRWFIQIKIKASGAFFCTDRCKRSNFRGIVIIGISTVGFSYCMITVNDECSIKPQKGRVFMTQSFFWKKYFVLNIILSYSNKR